MAQGHRRVNSRLRSGKDCCCTLTVLSLVSLLQRGQVPLNFYNQVDKSIVLLVPDVPHRGALGVIRHPRSLTLE